MSLVLWHFRNPLGRASHDLWLGLQTFSQSVLFAFLPVCFTKPVEAFVDKTNVYQCWGLLSQPQLNLNTV